MKNSSVQYELLDSVIINYEVLLKTADAETAARTILEGSYAKSDFSMRDSLDKFLDFVHLKAGTGYHEIISLAYPAKRILDRELELKIMDMINHKLHPEIILRLLKFFSRNMHNSDSNLNIAGLIESKVIIKSIFDTFNLFKNDIFERDPDRRTRNVKIIQQFPPASENRFSSPLDAAARFKYILEYLAIKQDTSDIYTARDIMLSDPDYVPRRLRAG